jgi:cell division protein FtsX
MPKKSRMTTRRFLTTAGLGFLAAAIALALAEILDAPWLRLVAVALIAGSLAAREAWHWRGEGRQWLLIYGTLILGTIALAFIAHRIAG